MRIPERAAFVRPPSIGCIRARLIIIAKQEILKIFILVKLKRSASGNFVEKN